MLRQTLTMSLKNSTSTPNSLHYPLKIDDENMEKEILKPFTYQTSVPGKKVRNDLLKVLEHWVTLSKDMSEKVDQIIFLGHNTSLLLDDIQDNSILRRGIPTAHTIFGIARTVMAADWNLSRYLEILISLDNLELSKCYFTTMKEMFAGQGMEIYWRDKCICPTETEYFQMIYRKTCLPFLLPQWTINMVTGDKQVDTDKLLTAVGIYFQINDDYLNLHNQEYFECKGFCEDITEGKFSFPIVHAINNFPEEGEIIMDILRQRTYDVDEKKRVLSVLEKCGSFEYTRRKLAKVRNTIFEEVAKLGDNPLMKHFIQTATQVSL